MAGGAEAAMKATIHFSVKIDRPTFEELQQYIQDLTALLDELDITYSINSEGAC